MEGGPHHTTLVTGLYNIGRDQLQGKHAKRSFDKYLNWFKQVLSINVPMVVFVPQYLQDYVEQHRPANYQTQIIVREFEDLRAFKKYYSLMQHTIDQMVKEPNRDGKIPRYFADCPEFITARYETIIFSKFDFLKEASTTNPFDSQYFIWLDAGTFYQEPPFNKTLPWPDEYKIRLLNDKFLVSDYNFNVNDKRPLQDKRNYLRSNRNEICAFVLGGTKLAIDRVHHQFWQLVDEALNMGVINNEQHFLQLMALEKSEWYYIWNRTRYHYTKLTTPLRDRMIPAELATGTYMGEHYPINSQIKVLAVATKNLAKSTYQSWENTARHYGYNYEILGQNDEWQGFQTKIKLYHERLLTVTEPYAVLVDSTDVFFCGSSNELFDKLRDRKTDVVVGGEYELYYLEHKGGKYSRDQLTSYFNDQSNQTGKFVYPNSGFIAGKTNLLRKLMRVQLTEQYQDDQVACIDSMYQQIVPMTLDYDTSIIGNVPNYGTREPVKCFEYDKSQGRYRNNISGEYPIAFHFPGKNWHAMREFYNISQADAFTTTPVTSGSSVNTGYIFLIVIIVLIIVLLLLFLSRR
jgi:hypothetical protein